MREYHKVEKCLKSFLKNNKRISYSVALLISFLINGGFSYADEAANKISRDDIQVKIDKEQKNIVQALNEADKEMAKIDLKLKKLMQRGEFWVKPLEDSYQVFFSGHWGNKSRNSNKTKNNFKEAEYTAEGGKGLNYGRYYKGIYYGEEGIIKNPLEFVDNIDFGANITPKSVQEKTISEKTVSLKNVTLPSAQAPSIKISDVKVETPATPTVATLATPASPNINVTAPGSISTLSSIEVAPISTLNINPALPPVEAPAQIASPKVEAPQAPNAFSPKLIIPPEAPVVAAPNPITINLGSLPTLSTNPSHYRYYWWNGNDGDTSQTSVVKGSIWKEIGQITTKDYEAHNTVGNGGNTLTTPTTSSEGVITTISGKTTHDKVFKLNDGKRNINNRFFLTVLDTPYSYFGKDVKVYSEAGTSIVDLETEGKINMTLEQMKNSNRFSDDSTENEKIYNHIKKYRELSIAKDKPEKTSNLYFVNKGNIELGNDVKFLTVTTHTDGEKRINVIENAGNIVGINNNDSARQQYGFYHSPDTTTQTSYVYVNSGKMDFHAKDSAGAIFSYSNINNASAPDAVFVNDGEINLYGVQSMGIAFNTGGDSSTGTGGQGIRKGTKFIFNKPVKLYGDNTVGLYNLENNLTKANESQSTLRAIVGEKDNNLSYVQTQMDNSTRTFEANSNLNGKEKSWVDNAVGVYNDIDGKLELKVPQLDIKKYSKGGVGVYANKGAANIEEGKISIEGGEENIALYSVAGTIDYKGDITMGSSSDSATGGNKEGSSNIGLFSKKQIDMTGKLVTKNSNGKAKDSIAIYADDGKINLKSGSELDIDLAYGITGNNTGIYAKGTNADINIEASTKNNIKIDGTDAVGKASNKGVALFTSDGGKISINGNSSSDSANISVKNGASALVAIGNNSKIEAKYAKINYDGEGYAVYTKDNGKIDISNGEITLRGKSTAMELDKTLGTNPVTFTNGKIKVMSNDVIVYNITNANTPINVSNLKTDINNLAGNGVTVEAGTENGVTYNKYKLAALDGGTINIDTAIDKNGDENSPGGYFFKKFLGQRLKINVNEDVVAKLTSTEATNSYDGQIVGIEANSSVKANSNNETQVNIKAGKKIEAARTDGTDKGATGVFINYGVLDNKGSILVEKDATANSGAVGVYAVNGSKVDNSGIIDVGGNDSIGVLAMANRVDSKGTVITKEFGGKTGEGLISVNNEAGSKITMNGDNATAIYAQNNNGTSKNQHQVVNKGEITVANSANNKVAIGIYADNVTVKPEDGKINIGNGAVGIYSKNSTIGEQNKNLGTVNFKGENGVALYLTGEENKSSLAGNKITLTNADSKKGNIGIYVDYEATNNPINLTTKVETTSDNITAYYTKSGDLKVNTDLKINKNSVGITGDEGKNLTYGANHTLEVGEKSTGILAKKAAVNLENNTTVKLTGQNSVGIYSDSNKDAKDIVIDGKLEFGTNSKNSVGVYALNKTNVNLGTSNLVNFNNSKNNIGFYLAGSSLNGRPTETDLNYSHADNNIYIYAQGSKASDGTLLGSYIKPYNAININPTGTSTASAKAIGIYLDTSVKGETGKFADNDLNLEEAGAVINAKNEAIGVYAKNSSIYNYNKIISPKISSDGEKTVGVYADGSLDLVGIGNIDVSNKAIGVYGNKGKVVLEDTQNVSLTSGGTGMYLTNGSYLDGGKVELKNNTSGTTAAGVYYTKGNSNTEVNHNTKLSSKDSSDLIALYADGEVNLKNRTDIELSSTNNASKNIAAYVTKNSKFTNEKNISLQNLDDSTGIYVTDGEAINDVNAIITVLDNAANKLSVGMAASKATSATKAQIENKGTIDVTGETIGMYVANNSKGLNSGKILAKNNAANKAIGVYVKGENASFDGRNGEISSDNIALALEGTKEGKIKTGTLKLTSDNSVGVYADNSELDFDIEANTTKDKTVALYAKGTTKIKNKITSAAGKGHVGVYVADSSVNFDKDSSIVVKNGLGTDYGIGIYTAKGYTGNISTNIKQEGKETIGLYLGSDGTVGSKVEHSGNINSGKGIGVYIPEKSEFIAKNTTFNVDGGTAVYLKGGKVDLGKEGAATINFGNDGGTAIVQDGGDISTGSNLIINGKGSFVAVKNGNPKINSTIRVGESGIGINSVYDKAGNDYNVVLDNPNGKIQLDGDKAIGIATTVANTVSPNSVTIQNKGKIETLSGKETIGIFSKGANIENTGKISIGAKGVAIYSTNENANINTKLNNAGEIELLENEAKGIVINKAKTNQGISIGKINGSKDKQIGVYVKNSEDNIEVKDAKVSLGTNAKGLVFEEGKDFKLTATAANKNKITIGDTTDLNNRGIGIAAIGVNGEISNTELTVGAKSLGLYAKDKQMKFDLSSGALKSTDGSSILTYANGSTSKIELNGGGTLKISENGIALGTNKGKIEANNNVTVEVNGANGIGAYINSGGVSDKFDVKVKSAGGIGVYAKGNVNSFAKVTEIKGNKSKAYIFEDISNSAPIEIAAQLKLDDKNATEQVGVYAKGSGSGLRLNGISVEGSKNIGVYSETGKTIENNGTLAIGDSAGDSSIGIYSKNGEVKQIGDITVGKKSIGINTSKAGVAVTGNVNVKDEAIGLYVANTKLDEGDTKITGNLTVGANKAIGVQVSNSKVSLTGDLKVGAEDSKGIFSEGTGNVELGSNIEVAKNSVAVYKKGTGVETVKTTSGKTISVAEDAYGIFTKNANVENKANLNVGKNAIGIYTDNANIHSVAAVKVTGEGGVGLLLKGNNKTLNSTGTIETTSGKAVGIYANGANVIQTGDVKVANNDSIGIYSKGEGNITTSGNITVGKDSIAVYKDGHGIINVGTAGANHTLTVNDEGYGIYYKGDSNASNSKIISNMNMTLGKEAVGIYGKNTEINQTGNITVGETTIGSNGFSDPEENKNSIGIFGDNSNINYKGNMLVDKALSVGIYAGNGGSIKVKNGSTITVKNGATGLMAAKGATGVIVENGATINVQGKANDPRATDKNVSFGIVANSGEIDNRGTINVTDGATGIYVAGTAYLKNGATGTIVVDANSKSISLPSISSADIGGVKVTDKGKVTIGDRVINGGTVKIKGDLNMQGMGIDISTGKTIIDAKTITGTAYVTPDFSNGNSEQKITIKDVFRTSPEGIGNFSGDIKSKSVSWIAKISKDPNDTTTTTKDITMVRLPYNSLIAGNRYQNLATGLEKVRANISKNDKSPIFQSLDRISSHKEFAQAISNIRGDVYSNIQERMKTVEHSFEKSYDELLDSYNVTRDVNKFSVISTKGKHKDNTIGVSGYEYSTMGVLYLNDREGFKYGEKYGWSAGLIGSNFDFEGRTNKSSKENVISGKIGLHYQKALDRKDDNARLKWSTRGEFTVNSHKTKRNSQIGQETYKNTAKFYSTELSWKNKLSYDYDLNTNWTLKPYTGLDVSYGHISKISEHGEGLKLNIKGEDYFLITPKLGVETKYTVPITANHQLLVKADTELSYDVTELYKKANRAKLKDSGAGYYKLSEPESRRAKVAVGLELGVEKENTYGLTFRAEYRGDKKEDLNYGLRLNYKF